MLEIALIASILFLIFVFFYKQAVTEFRINQIEWSQKEHLSKLYSEKLPIVIRTIPSATFWTSTDRKRSDYDAITVFHEMTIATWLQSATSTSVCPWRYSHAEQIARVSGIAVWAKKWIHSSIMGHYRYLTIPTYYCWAGNKGLHKTISWTFLFATEGEIHVTILPETMEQFLPAQWMNMFPANITEQDTPFANELKYIDIILRPGTALFMPPHWFMSWTSPTTSQTIPMVCSISYHTPISYLAFQVSPYVHSS